MSSNKKVRIAILGSGGGTNAQAIIDAWTRGENPDGDIALVISSAPGKRILERAQKASIVTEVLDRKSYANNDEYSDALLETLQRYKIDLVVLAGFMYIIGGKILREYENRIINIHPALIPSFCGEGMYGIIPHQEALKRGVKVSGATVHFVNKIADGGPIIMQDTVDVLDDDTPETLQSRIMEQVEWRILPKAIALFCSGKLEVKDGKVLTSLYRKIKR